ELPSNLPSLTLFPYTTLFRSRLRSIRTTQKMFGSERASPGRATVLRSETESTSPSMVARHGRTSVWTSRNGSRESQLVRKTAARSEEHTSELQSPYDLVCRLL